MDTFEAFPPLGIFAVEVLPDITILPCEKSMGKTQDWTTKTFGEVFRSFRKCVQCVRKIFEVFGRDRTDPFGPAGMRSDAFGCSWKHFGIFEEIGFSLMSEAFFNVFHVMLTKTFVTPQYAPLCVIIA